MINANYCTVYCCTRVRGAGGSPGATPFVYTQVNETTAIFFQTLPGIMQILCVSLRATRPFSEFNGINGRRTKTTTTTHMIVFQKNFWLLEKNAYNPQILVRTVVDLCRPVNGRSLKSYKSSGRTSVSGTTGYGRKTKTEYIAAR